VDFFVKEGLVQKIKQQFQAKTMYITSNDKLRQLRVMHENVEVKYPYIFLNVQSWSAASDRYNSNGLTRQGIPVRLATGNNQYQMVRVIPVNFEIELTFITNKYDGIGLDSVDGFARRWFFARRNGSLNFVVNYGMTDFPVTYSVNEALSIPPRESPTDQEPVYQVVGNLTMLGYISEPVLGTRGRIQQVVLSESVPTLNKPGEQFFPF
jgi:hypothetical protein